MKSIHVIDSSIPGVDPFVEIEAAPNGQPGGIDISGIVRAAKLGQTVQSGAVQIGAVQIGAFNFGVEVTADPQTGETTIEPYLDAQNGDRVHLRADGSLDYAPAE